MKKLAYLLIAGTVLSLSACKSSQNAYKEAYEKAVADDGAKAVIDALSDSFAQLKPHSSPLVVFAGQNISEDYMVELQDVLSLV